MGGMLDIFFYAALAGYIFYKLYTVLGRKDGADTASHIGAPLGKAGTQPKAGILGRKDIPTKPVQTVNEQANIVEPELKDKALQAQVEAIRAVDGSFSVAYFLNGAKAAFEMLLQAYNEGDKKTLRSLLSDEAFKPFEQELERQALAKRKSQTTLVSIQSADIKSIKLVRKIATIAVEFVTEQISVVKDAEDKIIEGDPADVDNVTDMWVFERDLTSGDPNWTIVSV